MRMNMYHYYGGNQISRECVEFSVMRGDRHITDCVVDVDHLLCGIKTFPCGNGDDLKLTLTQQLEVLKAVQSGRERFTKEPVKTAQGWKASGVHTFGEYCKPGDLVDDEIVEHFVESVPPHLMRSSCTQAGEAYSSELDPETGKYRATWTTFHKEGDVWIYDGECFSGQNVHRAGEVNRLEKVIEETRKELFDEKKRQGVRM